jgi:hypothetical protein
MIPLLNEGAAGLRKMFEEAERLGLVFSTEAAQAAEVFNDNLRRLGGVFQGIVIQITEEMVPGLATMTDKMVLWALNADTARTTGQSFGDFLATLPEKFLTVTKNIDQASRALSNLIEIGTLVNNLDFSGALEAARSNRQEAIESAKAYDQQIETLRLWGEVQALRTGSLAADTLEQQEANIVSEETIALNKLLIDQANQAAQAFDLMGLSLTNSVKTPMEEAGDAIDYARMQLRAGNIDATTFGRIWAQNAQMVANQYLNTAGIIAGALGDVFGESKAVAIAQAIINTLQGITQAMTLPFPLNWAQAAAVAAAGFAQVAKIRSTQPGAGGGGAGAAGIGGGGGAAQAGAAGTPAAQGGADGQHRTLVVQGISPNQIVTGEFMRDFLEQVADAQRDGYQVVVA